MSPSLNPQGDPREPCGVQGVRNPSNQSLIRTLQHGAMVVDFEKGLDR